MAIPRIITQAGTFHDPVGTINLLFTPDPGDVLFLFSTNGYNIPGSPNGAAGDNSGAFTAVLQDRTGQPALYVHYGVQGSIVDTQLSVDVNVETPPPWQYILYCISGLDVTDLIKGVGYVLKTSAQSTNQVIPGVDVYPGNPKTLSIVPAAFDRNHFKPWEVNFPSGFTRKEVAHTDWGASGDATMAVAVKENTVTSGTISPGSLSVSNASGNYAEKIFHFLVKVLPPPIELSPTGLRSTSKVGRPGATALASLSGNGLKATPRLSAPATEYGAPLIGDNLVSQVVLGSPAVIGTKFINGTSIRAFPKLTAGGISPFTSLDPVGIRSAPYTEQVELSASVAIQPRGTRNPVRINRPTVAAIAPLSAPALVSTPTLSEPETVTSAALSSGTLVSAVRLGHPTLVGSVNLPPLGIVAQPTLDRGSMGSERILTGASLRADLRLSRPELAYGLELLGTGLVSEASLGRPVGVASVTIGGEGISATPRLSRPVAINTVGAVGHGVVAQPILGKGSATASAVLSPVGIRSTPEISVPLAFSNQVLAGVGLRSRPVLSTPALGVGTVLQPVGISAKPWLSDATLTHFGEAIGKGVKAVPSVTRPAVTTTYNILGARLDYEPVLGAPEIIAVNPDLIPIDKRLFRVDSENRYYKAK